MYSVTKILRIILFELSIIEKKTIHKQQKFINLLFPAALTPRPSHAAEKCYNVIF